MDDREASRASHPHYCTCSWCVAARMGEDRPYYRLRALRRAAGLLLGVVAVSFLAYPLLSSADVPPKVQSAWDASVHAVKVAVHGHDIDPAQVERMVVHLTNAERRLHHLGELRDDPKLANIAREHSANMARLNIYDHRIDGNRASDRARAAGYPCFYVSENIHKVYKRSLTTEAVATLLVNDWMDSPGHRANIMDSRVRRLGVGVVEDGGTFYVTQNFAACDYD